MDFSLALHFQKVMNLLFISVSFSKVINYLDMIIYSQIANRNEVVLLFCSK